MVRFVHSTHSQFHPSVAGKWLVWGTLMMLLAVLEDAVKDKNLS